jgi:anti-sigma regulatory factor (Ser/Thr protein kinase)
MSRVPAAPDAVLRAREWVFAELRDAEWPESCAHDVALAVDEAVQNAVEHGSVPDGEIRIDLRVADHGAEVRVRDRGRPGASPPTGPPRPPDERAVRGRGRLIMANLADVDWRPVDGGGTEVRLCFGPADGAEAPAG